MVASALLLLRTSFWSVVFLTVALFTLGSVMFDNPDEAALTETPSFPSLAPIARTPVSSRPAPRSALFDPERRPETSSGSIDDLKPRAAPETNSSALAVAGVLLDGSDRKAMFQVAGGPPTWSAVGADVGGWHVASIDAEGAVVERDGETLTLRIADHYKHRSKSTAPDQPATSDTPTAPPDAPPSAPPDGAPQDAPPAPPSEIQ